jgi:hypothetical protein
MGQVLRDLRLTSGRRHGHHRGQVLRPSSQLVVAVRSSRDRSSRLARSAKGAAVVLVPIVALLLWIWVLGAERRAVVALPPQQRLVAYETTLRAFETMCGTAVDGLDAQCRTQAHFLADFPECDDRCRHALVAYLKVGTR